MSESMLNREQCEQLEALIDSTTFCSVLLALAEICEGKAEHVQANWQDESLAREWERNAFRIRQAEQQSVL